MANLNTTSKAEQLLGTDEQRIAHHHSNQSRLKKNKPKAGNFSKVQDAAFNKV